MNTEFSEIELRKLDLNLLLVFSAVMRERSVGKAADRLFIGPSAVSMALSRLRVAIGDQLFVKTSDGMEPTSSALALWKELVPALSSIESSVRSVRSFDPSSSERTVRFAAPDDLDVALLPRLYDRLAEEAPGIRMIVRPADYRTLLDRLNTGDADLALSATPPSLDKRHRARHLYDEPFAVLYCSKQLAQRGDLNLDTYVRTPHLFRSLSGDFRGQIDDALATIGETRKVGVALSNFSVCPFMLKTRPSLINMPAVAAYYFANAFDLEISTLPIGADKFSVSTIWHSRSNDDAFHRWFRDIVAEACLELVADSGIL